MIKAVGPTLLVKKDPLKKKVNLGGVEIEIVQGDSSLERRMQAAVTSAVVIQLGNMAFKDWGNGDPWCKPGDRVVFAKYAGRDIDDPDLPMTEDDQLYTLINDEDVIAVVTKQGEMNV